MIRIMITQITAIGILVSNSRGNGRPHGNSIAIAVIIYWTSLGPHCVFHNYRLYICIMLLRTIAMELERMREDETFLLLGLTLSRLGTLICLLVRVSGRLLVCVCSTGRKYKYWTHLGRPSLHSAASIGASREGKTEKEPRVATLGRSATQAEFQSSVLEDRARQGHLICLRQKKFFRRLVNQHQTKIFSF